MKIDKNAYELKNPSPHLMALVIAVLFLTAALAGCGGQTMIDDSGEAGIIGVITAIDIAGDGEDRIATILVEGTPEENAGLVSDKASVTLTKDTVLVIGTDKKYLEADDTAALAVGTHVEVVFTGAVAESYPVQGSAKVIRISPVSP